MHDFGLGVRASLVAAALIVGGCDLFKDERQEKAEKAKQQAQQVETAQEALKRSQQEECKKLAATPDALLETSGLQYHDKGIINDYRQLTGLTVLNKARYCAVRSAEGDVTWLDAQGRRFGSTPFTLRKSIPAGATERFSVDEKTMTCGTLEGAGVTATIKFTRVDVIEPP